MKKSFIGIFLLSLFVVHSSAYSITLKQNAQTWWPLEEPWGLSNKLSALLDGRLISKKGQAIDYSGVYSGLERKQFAIVAMVAKNIVEHGGYFCPYQIECVPRNNKANTASETYYFAPTNRDSVGCTWLCESGYYGENCSQRLNGPLADADNVSYTSDSGGKFYGLSLNQSGSSQNYANEIEGFATEKDKKERQSDTILMITEYKEHSVLAGPVRVVCDKDGFYTWVSTDSVLYAGGRKFLCARGYILDTNSGDCIPATSENSTNFCEGFPEDKYNSSIHELSVSGNCTKFLCKNGKAFPAAGDYSCVDCGDGIKGGPNPDNGLCMTCDTGKYFDGNECVATSAVTKTDMVYGKGKTKTTASQTVTEQCWTKVAPDEYKKCVLGMAIPTRAPISTPVSSAAQKASISIN